MHACASLGYWMCGSKHTIYVTHPPSLYRDYHATLELQGPLRMSHRPGPGRSTLPRFYWNILYTETSSKSHHHANYDDQYSLFCTSSHGQAFTRTSMKLVALESMFFKEKNQSSRELLRSTIYDSSLNHRNPLLRGTISGDYGATGNRSINSVQP